MANRICDDFGLDTYPMEMAIKWMNRCRKSGFFSDQATGLPTRCNLEYLDLKEIADNLEKQEMLAQ
jgi:aldehyde:ferredoxin oxidoreductase